MEIDGTWPVSRNASGFKKQQRSYVETHPPHLLSGMLRCGSCGAAMGQVSGKSGGYYGCLGGAKRACANRLLVPRKLIERCIIMALRERIADPQMLAAVLARVEENLKQLLAHVPQQIKEKRVALATEERRVANFVEFIGEGKGTRALATALGEAERRVETLRMELDLLTSTASAMFQTPPLEWIADRVRSLDATLAKDTTRSALVLREALGTITLRPLTPAVGRPYYHAETALQVLNLLQDPEDGSNSLRKWRRGNRTPVRRLRRPCPRVLRSRQVFGIPTMATLAHTRSEQRFPVDLERFWNVRSGHCFKRPIDAQHEHATLKSAGRKALGVRASLPA